jgi:nitrite reductase/ring-hydroxylating ferredoxin subunit
VRILGEDLTLFRGESGTPYLIGGRCAHRCTVLHTGWVQADQIRCMYHGWRYDGTGRCTEMPAERTLLRERLGASDAGVALLRKIILRELDAIEAGRPTKRWTPDMSDELPPPVAR